MENEFPKMLYKTGGTEDIHGGKFTTLIVADQAEQDAALAQGWSLTTDDALAVKAAADAEAAKALEPAQPAMPTRAELEQKATELEIKFDGRTSDKKLFDLINATLEP